jgi:FkbM family methyltransferase
MITSMNIGDSSPGSPPVGAPFISYAQNFEDILLARVFAGKNTGFYVDIGAFDPSIGSVTRAFYDRGWRGINIEPGLIFTRLAAERPDDINLNLAVSDHQGEVEFIDDPTDPGQSRIPSSEVPGVSRRSVACDTLTNILAAHANGRMPDFIKIDVEGAEAAIITSTDWRRVRPTILVIEATKPWTHQLANQSWEPTLLDQGYHRAYFDGINIFYLPNEHRNLQRHFLLPVNVLDHFVVHDPAMAPLQHQLEQSQHDLAACEASYRQSRDDQARLLAQVQQLTERLETHQAFQQRLTDHLDWPDAPRALRRVLPIARWLRRWDAPPQPATPATPSEAIESPPPDPTMRARAQSLLYMVYRPFRPILRPIAWRLRWFLIGDVRHDLANLTAHLQHLNQSITDLQRLTQIAKDPPPAPTASDQLVNLVETALVTLALDAERLAADHRMASNQDGERNARSYH